ncbi:unnamed protein product [Rangifer tarandus platyrhynchus]|uniref:Uncharacterized protein n=1 Tax=Rangifer tarandus platyrhynchus TaxID=3082113 RepID=A0AC59ZTK9_RANTA
MEVTSKKGLAVNRSNELLGVLLREALTETPGPRRVQREPESIGAPVAPAPGQASEPQPHAATTASSSRGDYSSRQAPRRPRAPAPRAPPPRTPRPPALGPQDGTGRREGGKKGRLWRAGFREAREASLAPGPGPRRWQAWSFSRPAEPGSVSSRLGERGTDTEKVSAAAAAALFSRPVG